MTKQTYYNYPKASLWQVMAFTLLNKMEQLCTAAELKRRESLASMELTTSKGFLKVAHSLVRASY